ncbi:ShKT domain-containing protein [Aphelenchoides besseyi]|nr:ShKT domain-containing protein [Aphelenchoides besseyi]
MLSGLFIPLMLLIVHVLASLKSDETPTSSVHKVYRVVPRDATELEAINTLYRQSTNLELDFWKSPTAIGASADVMVPPDAIEFVIDYFKSNNLDYWTTIENVEQLILQREKTKRPAWAQFNSSDPILASFFRKRMSDDYFTANKAKYGFGEYHSYDELTKWMHEIERFYPQMAQVFTIGQTHENRPIKGIKIGFPISNTNKPGAWIDAGIHARFAAIHTAAYFIDQLISGYNVDPQITAYVNTLNFYILPVANPDDKFFVEDAYTFLASERIVELKSVEKITGDAIDVVRELISIETSISTGAKLAVQVTFALTFTLDPFVDEKKAILAEAFSEPEARAIRDKMLSSELRGKIDAFITLHTYSQMWIHPYNHERKSFPEDVQDLINVGKNGVAAIEKVYGTKFKFGTGADILYPSAGGSDDWAKAKAGVKYVYLLELRPGEEEWDGFLLSQHQLIPTARETWEGVKVVLNAVLNRSRQTQQSRIVSTFAPTTLSTSLSTSMVTTARPVGQRVDQQSLRTNFHDRLQRLRQSQMEARVRQQQFRAQPGQSVLQFGGIFPSQQSTTQRTLLPPNVQSFNQQPQSCTDRSRWCTAWLRSNPRLCVESSIFMRTDCRRSCFFCS